MARTYGRMSTARLGQPATEPGRQADTPASKLNDLPCARSWGAFLAAISDESDATGSRAAIRRIMDGSSLTPAMSERVPSLGGFLVPERLFEQIQAYVAESIVAPRSMPVTMDSLRVGVPILANESQANGAQALGGMTFAWAAESAAITPTAAAFERVALEARKAAGFLQFVPNELVDDASTFTTDFLAVIVGRGLGWFLDDFLIGTGSGVGEPQALVNSPAALAVTRNTSSSVLLADILNMVKKLHPASKTKATWIVADEVFGGLLDLFVNFGSATTGVTAPPNWLDYDKESQCWRLLGLECCPHDHLPALGSTGDVILADLRLMLFGTRQELTVERSQRGSGFVTGTSNFRFRWRGDSRYWPQQTYTTAAGQVVSPLVILQ